MTVRGHSTTAQGPPRFPMIVGGSTRSTSPDANPTKVRTDLLQHEVVVEAISGEGAGCREGVGRTPGRVWDELPRSHRAPGRDPRAQGTPQKPPPRPRPAEGRGDRGAARRGPVAPSPPSSCRRARSSRATSSSSANSGARSAAMENDKGRAQFREGRPVGSRRGPLGLNGTPRGRDVPERRRKPRAQGPPRFAEYSRAGRQKYIAAGRPPVPPLTLDQLWQKPRRIKAVAKLEPSW